MSIFQPRDYPTVTLANETYTTSRYIGPVFMGLLFETLLLGGLIIHTADHYHLFGRDPLRWLLLSVILLCIAGWGLDIATLYSALIYNFGDLTRLTQGFTTLSVRPIFTALVAAICQIFFLHRVWKILRRNYPFAIITGACILLAFSTCIANTGYKIQYQSQPREHRDIRVSLVTIWLSTQVATDFLITFALVGSLWFLKKRTQFDETHSYLQRLIRIALESAAPPAIFALGDLICFRALGLVENTHFFFQLNLTVLYAWALSGTLAYSMNQQSAYQTEDEALSHHVSGDFERSHGDLERTPYEEQGSFANQTMKNSAYSSPDMQRNEKVISPASMKPSDKEV